MDALNLPNGTATYLTSDDDITKKPSWLNGVKPGANGLTNNVVSSVIITNDKGNDTLDAFYLYFCAFNLGDYVLYTYLGNHVGDIEHNMIRFVNGTPSAIWYSQHDFGSAFTYYAVNKSGVRPISYSANGTHANWATIGSHEHLIPDLDEPFGPATDSASAGALWDPLLSAYYYSVSFPDGAGANATNGTLTAYAQPSGTSSYSSTYCKTFNNATSGGNEGGSCACSDHVPIEFLYFIGQWGDQQYPESDPRQVDFLDLGVEYLYTGGPTGPYNKALNRKDICPDNGDLCIIRTTLTPGD